MSKACEACKTRPAKIHYTEIVNNDMVTLDLCLDCAEEKGIDVQKANSYGIGDLIAGLIDVTVDSDSEKVGSLRCPGCGYEYSDFRRIGRFGCEQCYDAFATQLGPLLRHVHGSTHHEGKKPAAVSGEINIAPDAEALRAELITAIEQEDYERAAAIRDELQRIEEEGGDDV